MEKAAKKTPLAPSGLANRTTESEEPEPPAGTLITDHREILDLMTPVFDDAQHVSHAHKTKKSLDTINRMKAALAKCDQNLFPRILFRAYVPVFQSTDKSRYVENLLDFIYVMCITLDKEEAEQEEAKVANTFSLVILRCCTKHHQDSRTAVRHNITHLAVKLLNSYASIDGLGQKLRDKVKEMFMHRVKDKNATVRAYGAMGLKHFQLLNDPSKCPVTTVLIFHTQHDPNPEVRRTALKSLQVNEHTMKYIVERVSDVSELVRLSALTNLTNKVSMDKVTLDEREKIIQVGLTDTSGKIKKRAELLVNEWLKSCNDDVVVFLSKLDVVTNKKVCYLALDQIFKETTTESFKKVNLTLWGDDKLIPMEMLNEEVAFFWRYVVGKFRKLAFCAELLLPSTHDMCTYLLRYFAVYQDESAESHGVSVLEQLVGITIFISETCEEGGRREILDIIRVAFDFPYLDVKHVKVLMELFYKLQFEDVDRAFFELIQNMLGASRKPTADAASDEAEEEGEDEDTLVDLTENEMVALKMELGIVIHEKHKAIRERDGALLSNYYEKAQNIKLHITELGEKADSLRRSLSLIEVGNSPVSHQPPTTSQTGSQSQGNPQPTDYYPTALAIAFGAFLEHILRQPKVSDTAHLFCETFIVGSITNDQDSVRELVIQCMGTIGLSNPLDAKRAMLYALQALCYDVDGIRVVAYRTIFDLILQYGFDHFDDSRIQQVAEQGGQNMNLNNSLLEDRFTSLKMQVLDQLNSTNQDLVRIGATGLVKLTLARRISSAKIVSRLLVMWSNPVYENSQLARDLSMWLPLFAKIGEEQAFQIADSLLPTMRKLIYAGRQSPLADASPEKLVSFVASSTNVSSLGKSMKTPEVVHERMIHSVLNEMSTLGPCGELSIFAKALKFFNARGLGAKALESLLKKLGRIMQMGLNKAVTQSLKAFHKYLNGELLLVADKQLTANDTESPDDKQSSDSEESVHISDDSSGDDDKDAGEADIDTEEEDKDNPMHED